MVLHIGGDTMIASQDIIAIIDVETINASKEMRQRFDRVRREFEKKNAESCKTYVVTARSDRRGISLKDGMPRKDCAILCSTISSTTLYKRCGFVEKMSG